MTMPAQIAKLMARPPTIVRPGYVMSMRPPSLRSSQFIEPLLPMPPQQIEPSPEIGPHESRHAKFPSTCPQNVAKSILLTAHTGGSRFPTMALPDKNRHRRRLERSSAPDV